MLLAVFFLSILSWLVIELSEGRFEGHFLKGCLHSGDDDNNNIHMFVQGGPRLIFKWLTRVPVLKSNFSIS